MVGRQRNRALHTSVLHPALHWCIDHWPAADGQSSLPTFCIWTKDILQPPWGWCQWEPDRNSSITVNTSLPDSAVIPGMHSQCSTCQSMKLIRQGTCESKKAQVREGTSHSTRTYVLHLGVEHCTRWQLKRLNHDLSNTLWIRIQCTSQVRIQVGIWMALCKWKE